ncbi:MAG: 50S ribosomal protein L23 [Candidatus Bathyarchaeota archaeon]|jgi:large subunit ribosomal protein L23|nr:50S ribosomal protein L23 [Candidatus Bathyarchaeota archaeon]
MNPQDVILYPLMTERSVYMIENENKLVFIVKREATKLDISRAVKTLYGVEAESVNTLISRKSVKKAFVKLKEAHDASDLAIKLGIL